VSVGLWYGSACRILNGGVRASGAHSSMGTSSGSHGDLSATAAGASTDRGDVVAALSAALSLAYTLTSDSPWWQEAKATRPLVLIETLYNVAVVSASGVSTAVKNQHRLQSRMVCMQGLVGASKCSDPNSDNNCTRVAAAHLRTCRRWQIS
jgi:hypothetical protein